LQQRLQEIAKRRNRMKNKTTVSNQGTQNTTPEADEIRLLRLFIHAQVNRASTMANFPNQKGTERERESIIDYR